jgi:Ca2+ transporting ATPase
VDISSTVFDVDQSILTGESATAPKHVDPISNVSVNQDKCNMVFSGTLITRGKATAVVTFTASDTAIGEIWKDLSVEDETKNKSPLKEKLDEFGESLSKVSFAI